MLSISQKMHQQLILYQKCIFNFLSLLTCKGQQEPSNFAIAIINTSVLGEEVTILSFVELTCNM